MLTNVAEVKVACPISEERFRHQCCRFSMKMPECRSLALIGRQFITYSRNMTTHFITSHCHAALSIRSSNWVIWMNTRHETALFHALFYFYVYWLKVSLFKCLFHCLVENCFLQNETAVVRNFVRVLRVPLFLCESGWWTRRVLWWGSPRKLLSPGSHRLA